MEALDQLDQLGPELAKVVGNINPEELGKPTPCAAFDVRGVLDHMIAGATIFSAAFRGRDAGAPPEGDELANFGSVLTELAAAIHSDGALERTLETPFGSMSGDAFARYVVLDGLVHGWDLATATGQPYDPPAQLVAAATAYARGLVDSVRGDQTFAPATEAPANASPIEQLAAFTGRTVTKQGTDR